MSDEKDHPLIFIVYASHEVAITKALTKLLTVWGLQREDIFYCVQRDKVGRIQELLRNNLKPAPIVILLLSERFKHCQYGQGEAGAAVSMEKQVIPIIIPPLKRKDTNDVCEIYHDKRDMLISTDPTQASKLYFSKLKGMLKSTCFELLKEPTLPWKLHVRLSVMHRAMHKKPNQKKSEQKAKINLIQAYNEVKKLYDERPRIRFLQERWPNITTLQPKKSIVDNIKKSLSNGKTKTQLIFVGVSLKHSFPLIGRALKEFLTIYKRAKKEKIFSLNSSTWIRILTSYILWAMALTLMQSGIIWGKTGNEPN